MLRNYETALAAIILCLTAFTSAFSLFAIQRAEQAQAIVPFAFPAGTSHYRVLNDGKCVGDLEISLEKIELHQLKAKAQLRYQLLEQNELELSFFMLFNPLGQMVDLRIKANDGARKFLLTGTRIHPISMKFTAVAGENSPTVEREFEVPGPLLLQELEKEKRFALSYPLLQEYSGVFRSVFDQSTGDKALVIVEGTASCKNPSYLSLGPLLKSAQQISEIMQGFAGAAVDRGNPPN